MFSVKAYFQKIPAAAAAAAAQILSRNSGYGPPPKSKKKLFLKVFTVVFEKSKTKK